MITEITIGLPLTCAAAFGRRLPRNQQHNVPLIIVFWNKIIERCFRQNLSSIVDVEGIRQFKLQPRSDKGVENDHRAAILPQERMKKVVAVGRSSNHLPTHGHSSVTITEKYYAQRNKAQLDIPNGDLTWAWNR